MDGKRLRKYQTMKQYYASSKQSRPQRFLPTKSGVIVSIHGSMNHHEKAFDLVFFQFSFLSQLRLDVVSFSFLNNRRPDHLLSQIDDSHLFSVRPQPESSK